MNLAKTVHIGAHPLPSCSQLASTRMLAAHPTDCQQNTDRHARATWSQLAVDARPAHNQLANEPNPRPGCR